MPSLKCVESNISKKADEASPNTHSSIEPSKKQPQAIWTHTLGALENKAL